jgi:lipoprotein-releasing system permease protein
MNGIRWIAYVASRYVSRGRRNSPSLVFSLLGIATGVLALVVIISVMNGFQLGFIESILEISSYHLRLEGIESAEAGAELSAALRSLPAVRSVLPFEELDVLLRGRRSNINGALVRGVPEDALLLDSGLAGQLDMESGSFDLGEPYVIVLGAELARHLLLRVGDEVNLLSISGGLDEDANRQFIVSGIFRSGFYEYDLGWAFINIETAAELKGERALPVLGIKLNNRWQDQRAMGEIKNALSGRDDFSGLSLNSWRDYNRAFFGALRTEKLMMFILVGLIFIVVALNIFQAQRRIVLEKREEIGLLRALGASDLAVRLVFVWDGFIIGFAGAGLGLTAGLLIALNIQAFFTFLETTVNIFIHFSNSVFGFFGGHPGAREFAVFSPQIFYIKEIPSRVIPHEAVLIFMFGFFSALLAAWLASGKVSSAKPAEVLRYE